MAINDLNPTDGANPSASSRENSPLGAANPTVRTAVFGEPTVNYLFLQGVLSFVLPVVLLPLLPLWLLVGKAATRPFVRVMACELRERTLFWRHGLFFRSETTVPLEQIQDLVLKEGPLLRHLGLVNLEIETAGMSGHMGSTTTMRAISEGREFRQAVLARRDALREAVRSVADEGEVEAVGSPVEQVLERLAAIEGLVAKIEARGSRAS